MSATGAATSTDAVALAKLAFGVELEILVSPRPDIQGTLFHSALSHHGWCDYILSSPDDTKTSPELSQNRLALRSAIAECLRVEGGLKAGVPEDVQGPLTVDRYKNWLIAHETLREPPRFWGVEIVSRVLSTEHDWQQEIDTVFQVLTKYCEVTVTPSCGMHIHVSPGRGQRWTDQQLVAVCKGLSFFDDATTAVLPGDRKFNAYAKSNLLACEGYGTPAQNEMYDNYRSIHLISWAPLFHQLSGISHETVRDILQTGGKSIAWNFFPMIVDDGPGTIEFRRPPGVSSAPRARHWASFVLGLFSASLLNEWDKLDTTNKFTHPTITELHEFVKGGLKHLGIHCEGGFVEEWAVEDQSVAMTEEEREDVVNRWHAENDQIKVDWKAQGLGHDLWTPKARSEAASKETENGCWTSIESEGNWINTEDEGNWMKDEGENTTPLGRKIQW